MSKYLKQKVVIKVLQAAGNVETPDSTEVTVIERDGSGNITKANGATVPSAEAGYAVNAFFLDTSAKKVYVNLGTTSSCAFTEVQIGEITAADLGTDSVGDDEVDAEVIETDEITLTAAEVKALAATQKTLVAAPGATSWIEFISAQIHLDYGSEVFTEPDNDQNLAIKYTDDSGVQVSENIEFTGFLDQSADTISNAIPKKDAIVAAAGALNKPLVLDNIGSNEIGGNATGDSVVKVFITYRVHTLA